MAARFSLETLLVPGLRRSVSKAVRAFSTLAPYVFDNRTDRL
jgi:hypothetical protein